MFVSVRRRDRGWRARVGPLGRRTHVAAASALILVAAGAYAANTPKAYADATAPPNFPSKCPEGVAPPPGYPNPPPPATTPFIYTGPNDPEWSLKTGETFHGKIAYQVPFKGIVADGSITMKSPNPNVPSVVIPHLYASLCGTVTIPSLVGTVPPDAINLAQPNVYVAGLEALPVQVSFGKGLVASVLQTAAPNNGLDSVLQGDTTAAVSTLGMTCSITLNASFTTKRSGNVQGQPITGPTEAGQAETVSNTFAVPAVQTSNSCPAAVAQSFNRLLGLPAPAGEGTFKAPFCFDFELEGTNNPRNAPVPNPHCPWPAS